MSVDYYLVCKEKKLYMPLFTMNIAGCWVVSKNHVFDFILALDGEPAFMVNGHSSELPDDRNGWTFINAWHPHAKDVTSG